MRWLPVVLSSLAVATFASEAAGRPGGQEAPPLEAVKWYNAPPLPLERLAGKAVLIQVMRTGNGLSVRQVPDLNAQFERGETKGLVVIGITDEPPEVVEDWIRRFRPRFPIAVTANRNFEAAVHLKYHPTSVVVDPEGFISYVGDLGGATAPLNDAQRQSDNDPLFPKKLSKVRDEFHDGERGDAWQGLDKLAGSRIDEETAAWVEEYRAVIERHVADDFAAAKRLDEEGLVYAAVQLVEEVADSDIPVAAEISAWLAELEQSPTYELEMKAGPTWVDAQDHETEFDFVDAIKDYKRLVKKYEGTRVAEVAAARMQQIVDDGLPGFQPACRTCQRKERACETHLEEVKL